ncbi:TlpA family protein disulfide reductase [Emticicia sp. 17c]|uniref:TlpA family protein disulfide reductase n=1 Tax=Emticicia sp. 17c TaxID=3127704 RepID=UPI00301BA5B0
MASTTFAQGPFRISAEVQNPTERKAILVLHRDWIGNEEEYELTLNNDNRFSFITKITDIAYIDFYYADQSFHFWIVEPNDEISIRFDTKNFWKTLQVAGQGSEKGNYYTEHQQKFEIAQDWEKQVEKWRKEPLKKYFEKLDQEQARQLAFLENYQNLSQTFRDVRKADIVGAIQNYKVELLSNNQYSNLPLDSIRNMLKLEDIPAAAQAASLEYGNTYLNLVDMLIAREAERKKKELTETEEYYFIKGLYTKKQISLELAERLLGFKLKNMIDANGIPTKVLNASYDYLGLVQNRDYKNYINQLVNLQRNFVKGSPAKAFTLKDIDGKEVSLKDFNGKVVFLDFWASWCGPCIYDMKFTEKAKTYFKDKDVVFIQISMDTESEWREAIKLYDLKGINLRVDDNGTLIKNYAVTSVPSYFLIDKNGNFALSKTIDPSDNEGKTLIQQIEEVLNKEE